MNQLMRRIPLLVLVLISAVGLRAEAKQAADTIYKGVYVEDIDVSGMTVDQATTRIQGYVDSLGEVPVTLKAGGGNQITVTAGDLGLSWSNQDMVAQAGSYGKKGNIIKRYKARKDLEHENKVFKLVFDVDREAIKALLSEKGSQFDIGAVDASLKRVNGSFVIEDGQSGYKLEIEKSADEILKFLSTDWDRQPCEIELAATVAQPRGTKEELGKVKNVLGSFTTKYSSSGRDRSANVTNGCNLIDGITLYPGDTFSTYETISPFTEENGYFPAGSYLNGKVVDSLGGGICQVSTTLYNTVLRAELEVTERHNHSMIVNYVDPSSDAAIAGTSKDFKFVNSTAAPIYIEGITTNDKQITFTIYGEETRDPGREVIYESEVLKRMDPETESITPDPALPVGSISVQSAHVGYVARLWKVVKEGGVEVSRTEVNNSTYQKSPRSAVVGVSTPNPEVYNAIMAAIATGSIDHVKSVIGAYNTSQTLPPVTEIPAAEIPAEDTPVPEGGVAPAAPDPAAVPAVPAPAAPVQ